MHVDSFSDVNSTDMLLSRERREMMVRAEELEETKKRLENYTETCEDVAKLFNNEPYKNWLKDNFKVIFKYKQGPNAPKGETPISTWGKGKLKKCYEQKYKNKTRESWWKGWTKKQQAELERLKRGDMESLKETICMVERFKRRLITWLQEFRLLVRRVE
jgi:hypothetical protein